MFDAGRVVQAALEAAVREATPSQGDGRSRSDGNGRLDERRNGTSDVSKGGGSPARAFLIGAGIVTVGRLAVRLRGRGVLDSLQERLIEYEERLDGS